MCVRSFHLFVRYLSTFLGFRFFLISSSSSSFPFLSPIFFLDNLFPSVSLLYFLYPFYHSLYGFAGLLHLYCWFRLQGFVFICIIDSVVYSFIHRSQLVAVVCPARSSHASTPSCTVGHFFLFMYVFVCVSIYLSLRLFSYLFIYLSIHLFIYVFASFHSFTRSLIYSFVYSSIYSFDLLI